MSRVAYLFERFPSYSQTFSYREVAELDRQGVKIDIYSIRKPRDEPPQNWDKDLIDHVHYLPEEAELTCGIDEALRKKELPKTVIDLVAEWGRCSDFLRLYQAIYVGSRSQKSGVDCVHAHFAGMAARTAYWINRFFGIPFSFTAHANDIFAPAEFEISLEKLIGTARTVVAVSEYGANFLKERFPQDAAKIHRVYNGLDLAKFKRADFSTPLPTIIAVGRLIGKKGFVDLVQACDSLKKRGRDFRCEIIGEGPLEEELRGRIGELDLTTRIGLVGPRTQREIVERLASAHVFVLPSVIDSDGARDNLPTVIMEAMAAGLPVVSTFVGGIPEMVVHNETGFLVQPGDATSLADAIEQVIVDLALTRKLGARGRDRAEELFSIEKNVRELRAILL
jgi:glycosyltransferase involved in cell wall biosynthesis